MLFRNEEVYRGYSLIELEKVRNILSGEKIDYRWKVYNHAGQWGTIGSKRGSSGSFGLDMDNEKQYSVYVKKPDYEKAKSLVNKTLNT